MFDYCKSITSPSDVCTPEVFEQILHDSQVSKICSEIKRLDESKQTAENEEQEKQIQKQIDEQKRRLPAFCFHASFPDHHRHNQSAKPSGLVSLDLDGIDQPATFFDSLRTKALDLDLILAFVTPSTRGLKMVFRVPQGCRTLEEAQERLVEQLGVGSYNDSVCHDMARLAFAVPASYVLHCQKDKLFDADYEAPEGFCTERQLDDQILASQQPATSADDLPAPQPVASATNTRYIDGIAVADLVREFCIELYGQPEPTEGMRNNCLYEVTKLMRTFLNNDPYEAARVMPMWGLDQSSWWSTIRSAHSRPIAASTRQHAEATLLKLKRQKAIAEGNAMWTLPDPPKNLPPVYREFARVTPQELLPAVLLSLNPILGFFGTMAKANLADPDEEPEWRTPSFITIVVAAPASQKGAITSVYKRLTKEQELLEAPMMAQLNRYNANKKDSNLPQLPIRLMPERLSMTSLSTQLENAKGKHLMLFTPEIDTLKSSNGSGSWNDLSTVFRKAIDNDNLGQIFVSAESHCCNVPVHMNMLIEAQPETFREFMSKRNISNGLDSRCVVAELPDSTGCRKLKVKKMSEFEWKNVMDTVHYLQQIGHVVEEAEYDEEGNLVKPEVMERQIISLPRTRKALDRWGLAHQDHFLQTQENPAEDHYFRRAKAAGFQAAIVAAMCSGCRDTRQVTDFALWVAEYTLQSQLLNFGKTYNLMHQKRQEQRTDDIIAINQISNFNLFDTLPQEFTTADMVEIMQQNGRTLANPYNNVRRWLKNDMIEEVPSNTPTKRWRKRVALNPKG